MLEHWAIVPEKGLGWSLWPKALQSIKFTPMSIDGSAGSIAVGLRVPSLPGRQRAWLVMWILLWLLGGGGGESHAQSMQAVGSENHLWLVVADLDGEHFTVWLRQQGDPPDRIVKMGRFTGAIRKGGLAAAEDRLWTVLDDQDEKDDLTVKSFSLMVEQGARELRDQLEDPLPRNADLRSLAVNGAGLWALLRVNDAKVRAEIDAESPKSKTDAVAEVVEDESTGSIPAPGAQFTKDRLMHFKGGSWEKIDLPPDWPEDEKGWLLSKHRDEPVPVLLSMPSTDRRMFWVYLRRGEEWIKHVYEVEGAPGLVVPLWAQGQLVIARKLDTAERVEASLTLLRGEVASPLGKIGVDVPPQEATAALVSVEPHFALIVRDGEGKTSWTQMDLRGEVVFEPTDMEEYRGDLITENPAQLIMISVLVVSMLILFRFWKRDTHVHKVELPASLHLAGLRRRVVAAAIDMVPVVLVVMKLFNMPASELRQLWPAASADLEELVVPGVTLGIFLVLTLLPELLFATSLGKRMMGLRITTLDGRRPALWQLLVRNLFKTLEVIGYPLMVLPLLSPLRQRLGDMVARTLMVMPVKPDEDNSKEGQE